MVIATSMDHGKHGAVVEDIDGLIRVYKDGYVERPPFVPSVSCTASSNGDVACKDVVIDKAIDVGARVYVPRARETLPLVVYFHGGGFCAGSASWSPYHDFLLKLASKASCVIISVNYRLAPENRLPAAYDDGFKALEWVKQRATDVSGDQTWWSGRCDFSRVFLSGDSAGGNLAHTLATRLGSKGEKINILSPILHKGTILIQPFFGGEERTYSEKHSVQPPNSVLTLASSDAYWRLSLPLGANRDNPWCNPLAKGAIRLEKVSLPPTMVCISELDILKDRNMEFCSAMKEAGKEVEQVMYKGVGHAFQILDNYELSKLRTHEMVSHIRAFIHA